MAWTQSLATLLRAAADAIAGKVAAPAPLPVAPVGARLSLSVIAPDAFDAFVTLAGPVIDAARGHPTLSDAADVANLILSAVATLDPAAIPVVMLAEAAEPVAGAIFEFVKGGGVHITGGYRPVVGGFAGARGHI
jgi:hypothetical protein